ncbi:unnamed protein product, partial [Prunus brigantina]
CLSQLPPLFSLLFLSFNNSPPYQPPRPSHFPHLKASPRFPKSHPPPHPKTIYLYIYIYISLSPYPQPTPITSSPTQEFPGHLPHPQPLPQDLPLDYPTPCPFFFNQQRYSICYQCCKSRTAPK